MRKRFVQLALCGATDVGKERTGNEDALVVASARTGEEQDVGRARQIDVTGSPLLLAISDGMGGANAGEVASAIALEALRKKLAQHEWPALPVDALRTSVVHANQAVIAAAGTAERKGMGATLVAVLVIDGSAFIAVVGDSRAYVLRRGRLVQVTKDQSLLQQIIDTHNPPPEVIASLQIKNVILQAIGRNPTLDLPVVRVDLRRGDVVLLCSDGLSGEVADPSLRDLLVANPDPEVACRKLIDAANDHGGHDNISVIVAVASGDALPSPRRDAIVEATLTSYPGGPASPD
jgi:serine/threonine protein phosphatase PrpC